jgi:hypothetical protein
MKFWKKLCNLPIQINRSGVEEDIEKKLTDREWVLIRDILNYITYDKMIWLRELHKGNIKDQNWKSYINEYEFLLEKEYEEHTPDWVKKLDNKFGFVDMVMLEIMQKH